MSVTGQKVAAGRISDFDANWVEQVREQRDWLSMLKRDVDPVDVLMEATAEIGPVLTIAAYNRWSQKCGEPPAHTLLKRSKLSWVQLVELAGGRTGTRGARGKVSDQSLLEPLVEYVMEHRTVRYAEYSQWARSRGLPVGSTISDRFGSWDKAVASAAEVVDRRANDG